MRSLFSRRSRDEVFIPIIPPLSSAGFRTAVCAESEHFSQRNAGIFSGAAHILGSDFHNGRSDMPDLGIRPVPLSPKGKLWRMVALRPEHEKPLPLRCGGGCSFPREVKCRRRKAGVSGAAGLQTMQPRFVCILRGEAGNDDNILIFQREPCIINRFISSQETETGAESK